MPQVGDVGKQLVAAVGGGPVNTNSTTVNLNAVHPIDCLGGILGRLVRDEAEATAATSVSVGDDLGIDESLSGCVESVMQGSIGGTPGEVANKETGAFGCHEEVV